MGNYHGTIKCEKCGAELDVWGSVSQDVTLTVVHVNKTLHELQIEPMSVVSPQIGVRIQQEV